MELPEIEKCKKFAQKKLGKKIKKEQECQLLTILEAFY